MIYVLGAGGMARETLSLYEASGRSEEIGGFIEENCKAEGAIVHGKRVFDGSIIDTLPRNSVLIGAMGSPKRRRWIDEIEGKGFSFDTAVDRSVRVGDSIDIGTGCIICAGVVLTCDIEMGRHSIINVASTINHDCMIGDFVTIGPGVNIAGRVRIADECWLGIGVKIVNRVSIGKGSFVGAGAVVTKDIPESVLALGVPAKPIREMRESDWSQLI